MSGDTCILGLATPAIPREQSSSASFGGSPVFMPTSCNAEWPKQGVFGSATPLHLHKCVTRLVSDSWLSCYLDKFQKLCNNTIGACYRSIFTVITVVSAPVVVSTVCNVCFSTTAFDIVQPNLSISGTVAVTNKPSDVSVSNTSDHRYQRHVKSHICTVARECCKDQLCKSVDKPEILPLPMPNPLTDLHQIRHTWLYHGYLHLCKISLQSLKGDFSPYTSICGLCFFYFYGFLQLSTAKAPSQIFIHNISCSSTQGCVFSGLEKKLTFRSLLDRFCQNFRLKIALEFGDDIE